MTPHPRFSSPCKSWNLRRIGRCLAGKDAAMPLLMFFPFILWSGIVVHMFESHATKTR
jgi:hypothetical protein